MTCFFFFLLSFGGMGHGWWGNQFVSLSAFLTAFAELNYKGLARGSDGFELPLLISTDKCLFSRRSLEPFLA